MDLSAFGISGPLTSTVNPYALPPLFCGLFALISGLYVFIKNPRHRLTRAYLLICISIFLWLFLYGWTYLTPEQQPSLLLFSMAYCAITFIPITTCHYVIAELSETRFKIFLFCNYILGCLFSVLILTTDKIIAGTQPMFWGHYPVAGDWHPFYLVWFMLLCPTLYLVIVYMLRKSAGNPTRRNQVRYILLGFIIFNLAAIDFIPNYGIEVYPLGWAPTFLFMLIFAFAIYKHRLMDISIVLKKGLLYTTLLTILSITYLLLVFAIENVFQIIFNYNHSGISLIVALLVAILFTPLKNQIQKFIDHTFIKGDPMTIAEHNETLMSEVAQTEKLKAVANLSSGIAHEIKNPLTTLKTFFEFYPQKKADPEFMAKFMTLGHKEIDRMENLMKQMLDFAKPNPPEFQATDIHSLIQSILNLLEPQFHKNNIHITRQFNADPAILNIDPGQIKQALLNILLNAVDALPEDGKITIKTNTHSTSLEINITDNGPGIPEKDLRRIFEPFYSTKTHGTGLGLAITKNIIEENNGQIRLSNIEPQGLNIKITFKIM